LGTVLSFTDLSDEPLFPINGWSELTFRNKTAIDLTLPVNPTASALPIDFRDDLDICLDMGKPATALPDEQLVVRMTEEAQRRSGYASEEMILTASPALVSLHTQNNEKEHR
jgi:hypothetical protein